MFEWRGRSRSDLCVASSTQRYRWPRLPASQSVWLTRDILVAVALVFFEGALSAKVNKGFSDNKVRGTRPEFRMEA